MAFWSAENATKAYLTTLKMRQRVKEPDVAEFISALAAGNNAQLMVVACGSAPGSTTHALVAASHQTGGRVICIVRNHEHLNASKRSLGGDISGLRQVEFVIGEPQELLTTQYDGADFVLVDCKLEKHEEVLRAVDRVSGRKQNGTVVVGYNAFRSRASFGSKTQFLPIGEGLLVTKFTGRKNNNNINSDTHNVMGMKERRSRWIVKVDKCTGEEHVFRVRIPQGKVIHA
ncbi:hypothetical protein QN277_012111 [Acacia crassicarpa]|uniref:S-adenosyl-L-methionine-dependent methyltransferase n=1 Tax=Acacia crassicarpa TaxID=499986 RepID=A0AAE1TE88_9FABA|nr:hypothetical protein QN277_012111 [Acacia crassicarpa]